MSIVFILCAWLVMEIGALLCVVVELRNNLIMFCLLITAFNQLGRLVLGLAVRILLRLGRNRVIERNVFVDVIKTVIF